MRKYWRGAVGILLSLSTAPVCAQTATPKAAPPLGPTAFAQGADTWLAPPSATVTINRRTGMPSIALATQPIDGSREQMARYDVWRVHPYAGTGDYPATRDEPAMLPTHTLYYPRDLSRLTKIPVVLWANGGCRNTSVEFTRFLGELASHGYLVAAIGRSEVSFKIIDIGAPVGPGATAAGASTLPQTNNNPADMLAALDWALKENQRRGSPLFGKLDLSRVAAMGQSCGGLQAFNAAKDPRVTAVAALNSFFSLDDGGAPANSRAIPGWTVDKLAIPSAYFVGGPGDLAYLRAEQSYRAAGSSHPVLKVNMPLMGHTGAYPMPDTRWTAAVVSWLDWTLKGDRSALSVLVGPDCSLCSDPDLEIETKGMTGPDGK